MNAGDTSRRAALSAKACASLLIVGLVGGLGVMSLPLTQAGASPSVPYSDPNAVGVVGLCRAGHQITSGSVASTPFVKLFVSSTPAVSPYDGATRTATAYAYQPRQGLLPSEWSGEALTASSRYTNPAAPMAAATPRDPSLKSFLSDFPARWDGFVQIRLFLGAADSQPLTAHYPALNIQVTGSTWQAVGGGTVNCSAGTAVSLETIVLPTTSTTAKASVTTTTTTHKSSSTSTTSSSDAHKGSTSTKGGDSGSATEIGIGVGIGAVVLAALVAGGLWWRRRRHRATSAS